MHYFLRIEWNRMSDTEHVPVLLEEVLAMLALTPGMTVVDATLGGGGYTRALFERVQPGGRVLALDWDGRAIELFRRQSETQPAMKRALETGTLLLRERPFSELSAVLEEEGVPQVDAIVADLGLSSDQLSDPERGLSFLADGPLDMRLSSRERVTAADIVTTWPEERLRELLVLYGDEKEAGRIARAMVERRSHQPITRTKELADLVKAAVHPRRRFGRIHPATQTFLALRMAVNSERAELITFLPQAVSALKESGRLAVVTFHSGEDAIVKHFFEKVSHGCRCGLVPCQCGERPKVKKLSRKPIIPTAEEITQNPRSRSAKLRGVQKLAS